MGLSNVNIVITLTLLKRNNAIYRNERCEIVEVP